MRELFFFNNLETMSGFNKNYFKQTKLDQRFHEFIYLLIRAKKFMKLITGKIQKLLRHNKKIIQTSCLFCRNSFDRQILLIQFFQSEEINWSIVDYDSDLKTRIKETEIFYHLKNNLYSLMNTIFVIH